MISLAHTHVTNGPIFINMVDGGQSTHEYRRQITKPQTKTRRIKKPPSVRPPRFKPKPKQQKFSPNGTYENSPRKEIFIAVVHLERGIYSSTPEGMGDGWQGPCLPGAQ